MNINKYFAPDMRRAIGQVRAEHGPDAVILSSRYVDGGVEIIAAGDYDETLVLSMNLKPSPPADAAKQPVTDETTADGAASVGASSVEKLVHEAGKNEPVAPAAQASAEETTGVKARMQAIVIDDDDTPEAEAKAKSHSLCEAGGDEPSEPGKGAAATDVPQGHAREDSLVPAISSPGEDELRGMHDELKSMKQLLSEQFASLTWADLPSADPRWTALLRKAESLGIERGLAEKLVREVDHSDSPDAAWRDLVFALARRVEVLRQDPLESGGIFALLGPTGAGKTTTIAKLAARHCLRYEPESLALITTDSHRIGAHRQLDAYGSILGVAVRRAGSASDLERMIDELSNRKLILIDTAGMAPRDARLADALCPLGVSGDLRRFLVLPANMQASVMRDAANAFGSGGLAGAILTKLDEANGLGAALSVLIEKKLPAAWLSDGQRVPEDLKLARIANLIDWAAGPGARAHNAGSGAPMPAAGDRTRRESNAAA